jgi:NADH-quinone oxidoreductase subunit G
MVTVVICVGSSCYVHGSDDIAGTFESLIAREGLQDQVEMMGTFCMEQCSMGVSVRVGDEAFRGVRTGDAEAFFCNEIMPRVRQTTG